MVVSRLATGRDSPVRRSISVAIQMRVGGSVDQRALHVDELALRVDPFEIAVAAALVRVARRLERRLHLGQHGRAQHLGFGDRVPQLLEQLEQLRFGAHAVRFALGGRLLALRRALPRSRCARASARCSGSVTPNTNASSLVSCSMPHAGPSR